MTVNANDRRREYPGNGVALNFNGPMAFDATQILAYQVDDVSGAATLIPAANYTVTRLGQNAGTRVAMNAVTPVGKTLLLLRLLAFAQVVDITNQGSFLPETHEKAFDSFVMQMQQLDDRQRLALQVDEFSVQAPGFTGKLPTLVGLSPIVVKADRTGFEMGSTTLTGDMLLRGNLASTTPGQGAALIGMPAGFGWNQPLRQNLHFKSNGAGVNYLNERLFVNGATENDGNFPNVNKDWMATLWVAGGFSSGPSASAIVNVMNNQAPNAAIGVLSAIQTQYFSSVGTTGIGGFAAVFNNHASLATKAYGFYIEAHRTSAAAADTYGLEIDTRTTKATIAGDPYTFGDVVAVQLGSGCEWSSVGQYDASYAVQIAANPMKFKGGINVMNASLVDLGGGVKEAISLPSGALIRQWIAGATPGPYIYFAGSGSNQWPSLQFGNNALAVTNSATGTQQMQVDVIASAANYVKVSPATTGNPATVGVEGTDTNVGLLHLVKGNECHRYQLSQVRNFANDAAAAAASPAIPVGGLYRNGSVLMLRAA